MSARAAGDAANRDGERAASPARGLSGRKPAARRARAVRCQICKSVTEPGLDLGHQPIGDAVIPESELNRPETFYPMQLHHCATCGLTQLGLIVDPKVVYKNFPFVSGTTKTATKHLQSLPRDLVKRFKLSKESFALDIGSNDGTLLEGYRPFGVRFLGVDPSGDPVRIARERGIDTLHAFFNVATAEHVAASHGRADAITACGVFAHIADLAGVMKGVKALLNDKGVFATDSQYWLDMVVRGHYDNIFHQHLRYYAMRPLTYLFRQYGLDLFDVERSDVYGGQIRVFACHAGAYPISSRVKKLVALEEKEKLYDPATNARFTRQIEARRAKLFAAVYQLKAKGKRIVGFGAPAKASTVCNYCRLGPDLVDYITEVNPLRIGMRLPGTHIPIVDEERMFNEKPRLDAGILFAWNYYDEIVPKLRKRGFRGKVLLP